MIGGREKEMRMRIRAVLTPPGTELRILNYPLMAPELEIVKGNKRLSTAFEVWSLYRVLIEEFSTEIYTTIDMLLSPEVPMTLSAIRDAARSIAAEKQDGELRRRLEKLAELLDEALALFSSP